jgi:putative protein-disulfide isomerase
MKPIIITNFTDPVCVWCWGTEPVFRALETHFPEQIEYKYVCGGLVENIDQFADPSNEIYGSSTEVNKQIMKHWLEASERNGMPIKAEGFKLFSKKYPSTYPQNIAYKAAQIASISLADAYLRRLREATLSEAKVTSNIDVQIELASEVGLDISKFIKALKDGSAQSNFYSDLSLTGSLGVQGFPTFLIKASEARQVMLRGYQRFDSFADVISYLTDEELKPVKVTPDVEILNQLLIKHGNLAREEVYQSFDFEKGTQVDQWIDKLIEKGTLKKIPAGNSYFIRSIKTFVCNIVTDQSA